MKFIVSVLLTALLSFAACLYLPWWSVAIAAFLVSVFIHQAALKAFFTGFIGVFVLWTVLSYWISLNNNHILADKISLLILKVDSHVLLILVTGLIGGIVAGFAAMAASYARRNG